jgi:hypothetical protein
MLIKFTLGSIYIIYRMTPNGSPFAVAEQRKGHPSGWPKNAMEGKKNE